MSSDTKTRTAGAIGHWMLDEIDQRIDQVLEFPEQWGGLEVMEPMVLMLSMLRARVHDASATDRTVVDDYLRFLSTRVGAGAASLPARLGPEATVEKVGEILRAFVEESRGRTTKRAPFHFVAETSPRPQLAELLAESPHLAATRKAG